MKIKALGSNNTNKLSPQERTCVFFKQSLSSNNTNKLSPQEPPTAVKQSLTVQIIQINLVLKNLHSGIHLIAFVQIIQINLVLKNLW